MDTIVAISTPPGEGAIALIRLSGSQALELANNVFRRSQSDQRITQPRFQYFGTLYRENEILDEVMLTYFRAPSSYTGEDMVEISCHGGVLMTHQVLRLFLDQGIRLANPGEFTERAFLNDKMDLTQAEAVMDLIHARTPLALRSATEQLQGNLGKKIEVLRERILNLLAHTEASIDFPEEGIDPDTGLRLQERCHVVIQEITELLSTAEQGRILREGLRLVICGEPNVGKSSLLNLLLGYDRAIVSTTPGTTRDTIEEVINLRGFPIRLTDTAGLRDTKDVIEQAGIDRTKNSLEQADLILHVVDGINPPPVNFSRIRPEHCILVVNKIDLETHKAWNTISPVFLSCTTGKGKADLEDAIFYSITNSKMTGHSNAINARHQACLQTALQGMQSALQGIKANQDIELIALELRIALDAIGEIVGRVETEELLGNIFSQFCIGK